VVVSATIAGRGPFRLLVDTGSNRSALSDAASRSADGRLVARTEVVSSAGSGWRNVVEVGPVVVGPAAQPRLLATVLPSEEVRALGTGIDGILGQDFLRTFSYTIDYRQRQLLWNVELASVTDANKIRLTLRPEEGRFLVELPQGPADRRVVRFVPDSGADMVVMFERAGELPIAMARPDRTASVLGLGGRRGAAFGSIAALRIGSSVWRNCPAAVLPGRDDAPHVDGLLPLRPFSRVSFFPNDGVLVVVPR
jgi:predicted aspartyl protease